MMVQQLAISTFLAVLTTAAMSPQSQIHCKESFATCLFLHPRVWWQLPCTLNACKCISSSSIHFESAAKLLQIPRSVFIPVARHQSRACSCPKSLNCFGVLCLRHLQTTHYASIPKLSIKVRQTLSQLSQVILSPKSSPGCALVCQTWGVMAMFIV